MSLHAQTIHKFPAWGSPSGEQEREPHPRVGLVREEPLSGGGRGAAVARGEVRAWRPFKGEEADLRV